MRTKRRGQSLVEFALVSLVVYMLLAAILTFGHMLFVAQGTQQAADLLAREISRTPLPVEDSYTLAAVLRGNVITPELEDLADFRKHVYDEHYLVLNLDTLHGRSTLQDLIDDLPLVNQQLYPLMIADSINGTRVLRYPGAVLTDTNASDDPSDPRSSGWLVGIPMIVGRDANGIETIDWVPVVEEIGEDPFLLTSAQRGVVALRFNYPYQSASMSSFQSRPLGDSAMGQANLADDSGVGVVDNDGYSPNGTPVQGKNNTYAGPYGLGVQLAFGQTVRPYRRVISAQAIYRREVFK